MENVKEHTHDATSKLVEAATDGWFLKGFLKGYGDGTRRGYISGFFSGCLVISLLLAFGLAVLGAIQEVFNYIFNKEEVKDGSESVQREQQCCETTTE